MGFADNPYLALITSEHSQRQNFMATVALLTQPTVDALAQYAAIDFDLDTATGVSLDYVGQWIGVTRFIKVPITGVFLSFNNAGLGFSPGGGVFVGPGSATYGIVGLPDASYRTLLYAVAAANAWDGAVPTAEQIWNLMFQPLGFQIKITDLAAGPMTMALTLVGVPNALDAALFTGGYLNLRPAGVAVSSYTITP